MSVTIKDFLTPLKTTNVQVVIKDLDLNIIAKIYADNIENLDEKFTSRTVNRWDIIRNNMLTIYLDNEVEPQPIVPVTDIVVEPTTLSLFVGETGTLSATVLPEDATEKGVTWITTDESILSVEDGTVTALAEGSANVIVTSIDGGYSAICLTTVTQQEVPIPVEGVSLSQSQLEIRIGDDGVILEATIYPEDATNKNVTWSSSDETIATVENGIILPVAEGIAIITVITEDGEFIDTCEVNILPKEEPIPISVTGVTLSESEINLTVGGESAILIATVEPEDATDKSVTWTSENEEIAIVEDGLVTPISEGETNIVVATVDGDFTATCSVIVSS